MTRILAAAAACGVLLLAAPALAAGSDNPVPTCKRGEVWDKRQKACVKAQSGVLPDEELADYAYALAKAERPEEALVILALVKQPNTPEVLNYRGYATRLAGRVEEGIGYYKQAVALDPDYTLVREYLGEAYVVLGDVEAARRELAEIEKRCGRGCEEYQDLAEAIEKADGKT
jgi:predicted Zn-dependent protease